MHRAKRFAPRECGWKHGDSGHSAIRKLSYEKQERIHLTPTGLLMEGGTTTLRHWFATRVKVGRRSTFLLPLQFEMWHDFPERCLVKKRLCFVFAILMVAPGALLGQEKPQAQAAAAPANP